MNTETQTIGGKASNLLVLQDIPNVNVPRFLVIPAEFDKPGSYDDIVETFLNEFPVRSYAVRSSAAQEDSGSASFAGIFETKLLVPGNFREICNAIEEVRRHARAKNKVVDHYASKRGVAVGSESIPVIVQEMVIATRSGVVLSHDPKSFDGYYSVSVTEGLGEAVVGGKVNGKLLRVVREFDTNDIYETWLGKLIATFRTIEKHFGSESLDVEFAFDYEKLYVLQCRPLATLTSEESRAVNAQSLTESIETVETEVEAFRGDILGDMIDINPLELLGRNPRTLDISIFKIVLADGIVEAARAEMGYDPLQCGLLHVIAGKPYVSLKASAFSFCPKGISREIYQKMYEVYRKKVAENPALQSRVEFDVFAMSRGEKLEFVMEEANLNEDERSIVRKAYSKLGVSILECSQSEELNGELDLKGVREALDVNPRIDTREALAAVIKTAKSFVKLARLAFYWKNSFEEAHPGVDLNELLHGRIHSVSSELRRDLGKYWNGELSGRVILERYGHLRPGQFCVFGESYVDKPDRYLFGHRVESVEVVEPVAHHFEHTESFENVVHFMRAREEAKFLLSRALDVLFRCIRGEMVDLHVTTEEASEREFEELLKYCLWRGDEKNEKNAPPRLVLPEVIIPGRTRFGIVRYESALPTFITKENVVARICHLSTPQERKDVAGYIVVIPNADPGYDYLFHSGIVGLITESGGPASHMCIRAIEMAVPACVGCGEATYSRISSARRVSLNCLQGQISILE